MRRCYRSVALALGCVLITSSTLSNSCGLTELNVYAAEAAPSEEVKVIKKPIQKPGIHTGEENVETEIPAEKKVSTPVTVEEPENENSFELEYTEYDVLLKIVEAEAGSEDIAGKMLVANVIMNRVNSKSFPNSVTEVVYQTHKGQPQFSPTKDGRIDSVTVSQETVDAVERVMNGEDSSQGALYFRSVHSKGTWHDRALQRIMEHGNHIFYIG